MVVRLWVRVRLLTVFLVLVAGGMAPAAPSFAFLAPDSTAEFSADIELVGNEASVQGRIFVVPGKQRIELDSPLLEHPVVIISDEDRNKAWLLDRVEKSYREHPLDAMPIHLRRDDWANLKRTAVGRETVNGVETTKFAAEGTGPSGNPVEGHIWLSDEGIVVRFAGQELKAGGPVDSRGDLRNIEVAPQDPALFEIPDGYLEENQL